MSTTTTTTYVSPKTSSFAPSPAPSFTPAPQRKTMSVTQTYFLAHKARAKLSSQAARPDHNLRLLVGHANLLDTLMLELADAEREQESWFNQSVRGASQQQQQQQQAEVSSQQKGDRHVQWADAIIEEPEEDWDAEDADDSGSDMSSDDYSDSDEDDFDEDDEDDSASSIEENDDILMADAAPLRRVSSKVAAESVDEDAYATEEEDDEAEDDEALHSHLCLTRSPSHSSSLSGSHISSPPDLLIEEDSDVLSSDDDDSMPPSPPAVTIQSFDMSSKKGASTKSAPASSSVPETAIAPTSPQQEHEHEHQDEDAFHDSTAHYFLPPRNPARLITALSVY